MTRETPRLDSNSATTMVDQFLERLPGYVPEWKPVPGTPDLALIQIYARYLHVLGERINAAPDKNKLAFLDLLGINLLPDQPARAPVVFDLIPNAGNSRVLAGTRVGAQVPGRSEPILFESERTIGLFGARLTDVVSIWPALDSWENHSNSAIGGQAFSPWQDLKPVPHELYLAHNTHFAIEGSSAIELHVELDSHAHSKLPITWELWDGEAWQGFRPFRSPEDSTPADSVDGTEGMTRSGIIRLTSDCSESEKRTIEGIAAHWIRGRVTDPLPSASASALPTIDRISVRTIVNRYAGSLVAEADDPVPGRIFISFLGTAGEAYTGNVFVTLDGPSPLQSFSGRLSSVGWDAFTNGNALTHGTYQLHIEQPGFAALEITFDLSSSGIGFTVNQELEDSLPDIAIADGMELDLSKAFYPFGMQPQPGTSFYIASELFEKSGATITLVAQDAVTPQESIGKHTSSVELVAEYWTGSGWRTLQIIEGDLADFIAEGGDLSFQIPANIEYSDIDGETGLWLRIRLLSGGYFRSNTITWNDDGIPNSITVQETVPPALSSLAISYEYSSPKSQPNYCFTYNDFQWIDRSTDVAWRGNSFSPFNPVADPTPSLYFGFDNTLPADLISLYFDIEEHRDRVRGPNLVWEYWNGSAWAVLSVRDETQNFALPGMVEATWPGVYSAPTMPVLTASESTVTLIESRDAAQFMPGDRLYVANDETGELVNVETIDGATITLSAPLTASFDGGTVQRPSLPRFGTPRTWIRARMGIDGDPIQSMVQGIFPNATWAAQIETIENEVLGGSNGQPGQAFLSQSSPILSGEILQVRELEGRRAAIELPMLMEELHSQGLTESDVTIEHDLASGQPERIWVTWQPRPHLLFSKPNERHYTVERSRGRLIFGSNLNGRIPEPGGDNIRLLRYQAGGGQDSNVAAGAINQLLGVVPLAQGVTNPRAAEGGANGEHVDSVLHRGPRVIRHRNQALTLKDYEDLAREASPDVAVARALPTTRYDLPEATGWVTLVVMPQSDEPQPQPSFGLRRLVHKYIAARAPAGMGSRLLVTGPTYMPVGIEATVSPIDREQSGIIFVRVTDALNRFLHPLYGGPENEGWPFGRNVYLSDVAATLEALDGVDYVERLLLLLNGTPHGAFVEIPGSQIVVPGQLRIAIAGKEG